MPHRFRCLFILGVMVAASSCASSADQAAWLSDVQALERHMAVAYANLEWVTETDRVDLPEISRVLQQAVGGARTRRGARGAVDRFVESFQDPHFRVERGGAPSPPGSTRSSSSSRPGIAASTEADAAVKSMGFNRRDLGWKVALDGLEGFETVTLEAGNPFPWGLLRLEDGRTVGVVRIAHFGEDGYPAVAELLWPEYAATLETDCDRSCAWRFRHLVSERLLDYLAAGVKRFEEEGIDALMVDVTSNGGGTDWAAIAARVVTDPLHNCPPVALVKHPHHAERIRNDLSAVEGLLEQEVAAESRAILTAARFRLSSLLESLGEECDLTGLFQDGRADCSQLAQAGACGALDYVEQGALADVTGGGACSTPSGSSMQRQAGPARSWYSWMAAPLRRRSNLLHSWKQTMRRSSSANPPMARGVGTSGAGYRSTCQDSI